MVKPTHRTLVVTSKGRVPYDEKHYYHTGKKGEDVTLVNERNFKTVQGQRFDLVLFVGNISGEVRTKFAGLVGDY
ncbi:hypothetical protein vBValSR12Z_4 [Vibrio phage vB_ValS_R12Z]|uniref:Uncharacterized protein n=5 Tax=Mardecavirus SSP002 TaxID=1921699 RepID=A0A384X3B7_9CAUD|nr:hypothetical protein [Vibrio alginolyticus]YP_009598594.1 hypothetical protein FDH27_gp003 [Vibrio phage SSP002]ATI19313.1 hypothetical protein KF5_003 [Vibrio phage vB_VpaS_KF5]ATI19507.1 hypothetical protein KF6_099 [Vibrio phage vB_VpaS_KF6]AUM58800.1 hypothetical protein VVP001_100 [Vibrio phage VVP001]QAY01811.1 hypothetical protein ValLY3_90 [Vibrio phage ValLY_3]QYW05900.1 hypothetical protein [Vibrio phage vB_VpS_C2]UYD21406.1 hypothetical protein [Vibrio phage 27Ua.3]UYE96222.1 